MTRASLREYAAVQRERYQHATRADKHHLLDEVVTVTGMHRKAAIRLLRREPRSPTAPSRAGRPRCYGPDVAAVAEVLWQASGRIGAHRLLPFVSELLERLSRCGELTVTPAVEKLVQPASRPTLARLRHLAQARDPHPDLHRVGRCTPGVLRGGSRRPLWEQHPGLLPRHPLFGRYCDHLGRARSRLGERATASGLRCPLRPRAPSGTARRPRH